jgi:arsenite methyltransferase
LAVAAGERVLDVGCGTGLLAEYIADRVGPTGYVLGVDPLPLRIELAQAKARPNLQFKVADAYDLSSIPPAGFDVVCLNAVFHWLPEKSGPTAEFARVLKPGGRLGISSGAKGPRTRFQELVSEVLARPPFNAYTRPPGGLTHRVDEQEMRQLLAAAGFAVKSIAARESVRGFASPELLVRYSEASSFGNLLAHLPVELRPAARELIGRELAALAAPDGTISQSSRRMVAIAVRR